MSKCVLPKAGEREGGILMWIADQWQDYELLDCGGGEKLERWDKQYLVRPDPQVIWNTPKTHRGWKERQGKSLFIIAVSFLITIWVVQPSHYMFQNVTAAKPKRRNPGPLFFVSLFIPIGPWAQRIRFFLSIHRINASA